MELDELLDALDRTAANLAKLEAVWERAEAFIPSGPERGSHPEYDDLCRTWKDLLAGLPKIDGWTITDELPDIDSMGQAYIDYFQISEPAFSVDETGEQPGRDLAEYRFRLNRARRRAARERLEQHIALIDSLLPRLLVDVPRHSLKVLHGSDIEQITVAVGEIERLVADTAERRGRWGDLRVTSLSGRAKTGTTSMSWNGQVFVPTLRRPDSQTPIRCRCRTSTWAKPRPAT